MENELASRAGSLWPPCDVTVSPLGGITGWMTWPADLIYRPVVGLFVKGSLQAAAPTFRIQNIVNKQAVLSRDGCKNGAASVGICPFRFSVDAIPSHITGASVICLETGQVLYPHLDQQDWEGDGGLLTVDGIVTRGLLLQEPPDVSGFNDFLRLSTRDQLSVLYLAILGREIDQSALIAYDAQLIENGGTKTVLDVRDEIITSLEFTSRNISIYDRVGLWMVWGGLRELVPAILPMPMALNGDPCEAAKPRKRHATVAELAEWDQRTTRDSVNRTVRSVVARSTASPVGIRFNDLLTSMQVGPRGLRAEGSVRAVRGRPGIVVFGPFLTLRPGHYRLTVLIEAEAPEKLNAGAYDIQIEAVYGRIILANLLLSNRDLRQGHGIMHFMVPRLSEGLLDEALFEFRIWSQGQRQYGISSISLEFLPPDKDTIQSDWLAIMSVGGAGTRLSDDTTEVRGTLAAKGHVVFGPYVRMLPGRYRLFVECKISECIGQTTRVDVEVAIAPDRVLAARTYELMLGDHALLLEFAVNEPTLSWNEDGDIEFRVHKTAGSELIIKRIKTIYDGLPAGEASGLGPWKDIDIGTKPLEPTRRPITGFGKGTWLSQFRNRRLLSKPARREGDDQTKR
jgi:hypothetical protein